MKNIDTNLKLIKEKINLIKVGIFKPESDSDLYLPCNVVNVINIDELGNIWFQTTCKNFKSSDLGKNIYSYLDFKSKGFNSRIVVSGPAQIVEETNNELYQESESNFTAHILLIKLKIMNAEFVENNNIIDGNILNRIKGVFQQAFSSGTHKQFQFQS